jgi:hypothetical protein
MYIRHPLEVKDLYRKYGEKIQPQAGYRIGAMTLVDDCFSRRQQQKKLINI